MIEDLKPYNVSANSGSWMAMGPNGPFRKWTLWEKTWWFIRYRTWMRDK